MGRVLEHYGKELLANFGLVVPQSQVAANPEQARKAAEVIGCPTVLKALVPTGKRGKAGAVKFANTPEEAAAAAEEILQMRVACYPVESVLVEAKIDIVRELYLSIIVDKNKQAPVVIASTEGGVDVEEVTRERADKICRYYVDPLQGLSSYQAVEIWSELGLEGKNLQKVAGVTCKLYQAWEELDAYLLEINPLVITGDGNVVVAAVLMGVDDGAMFRHPEFSGIVQVGTERSWKPLTELEQRAVEVNEADPYRGTARYTEMEGGDIGLMTGGGGGSMLFFDAIRDAGGKPANYSEFGGNPQEEKVCGLTKVILSKPGVKGLFVAQNITNNTQVDIVAKGVIRGLKELNIDPRKFPVVVREAGVNEAVARELFNAAGIEYYGDDITTTAAAKRMVEKMQEFYPGYGQ